MKKLITVAAMAIALSACASNDKVETASDITPEMIKTLPERELCEVLVNKGSSDEQVLLAHEELIHRDVNPTLCRSVLTPSEM
ncbi:uL4 family ribosomal protein [Motilimonas eburnea]|uniref:uL4 family ribosomal protein n=1 Tax=Motilimonas eburnea TaxID=1737488 RepID=UPI001E2EAEF6|nr:uL4 family ribosomal protein [Motilimonas eburnea]MCE2571218.1 hypothetical protein [Motilimonas eburnea]